MFCTSSSNYRHWVYSKWSDPEDDFYIKVGFRYVIFWCMFESMPVEWNRSKNWQSQLLQGSGQHKRHCVTCCIWTGACMSSTIFYKTMKLGLLEQYLSRVYIVAKPWPSTLEQKNWYFSLKYWVSVGIHLIRRQCQAK